MGKTIDHVEMEKLFKKAFGDISKKENLDWHLRKDIDETPWIEFYLIPLDEEDAKKIGYAFRFGKTSKWKNYSFRFQQYRQEKALSEEQTTEKEKEYKQQYECCQKIVESMNPTITYEFEKLKDTKKSKPADAKTIFTVYINEKNTEEQVCKFVGKFAEAFLENHKLK